MKTLLILIFAATLLCESCLTLHLSNDKKYRQFLPAKDKISASTLDTSKFIRQPFELSDFTNKNSYKNNKKIFEPIEGADIQTLLNTKQRYYVYFWNPVCAGTVSDIHRFDSLSKTGAQVLIVSLRKNYDAIARRLAKTSFSKYPYYTIEASRYSKVILRRQAKLMKNACDSCYEHYKDEIVFADYILIENGKIQPIMHNDKTQTDILR